VGNCAFWTLLFWSWLLTWRESLPFKKFNHY
jgi:hypothetical protein